MSALKSAALARDMRSTSRRRIYLGENIKFHIKYGDRETACEALDLTPFGLGAFTPDNVRSPDIGEQVEVIFKRSTEKVVSIAALVRDLKICDLRGKSGRRLALQFANCIANSTELFEKLVGEPIVSCHSPIRPQASCADYFMFNEKIFFEVYGFSASGIDLLVTADVKTILPEMPLNLALFLPGRKVVSQQVRVKALQFLKNQNQYRVFATYLEPDEQLLQAISETLVMFGNGILTQQLRGLGFRVGDVSNAVSVIPADSPRERNEVNRLRGKWSNSPMRKFDSVSRLLLCKMGLEPVATARLVFPNRKPERSYYQTATNRLPKWLLAADYVELSPIIRSEKVSLIDVFIPLMQQAIRMAFQSGSTHLVISGRANLHGVYEKVGFKRLNITMTVEAPDKELVSLHLYALDLEKALAGRDGSINDGTWQRVYRSLNEFLKIKSNRAKQLVGVDALLVPSKIRL